MAFQAMNLRGLTSTEPIWERRQRTERGPSLRISLAAQERAVTICDMNSLLVAPLDSSTVGQQSACKALI